MAQAMAPLTDLLKMRDQILESLRIQFKTKVDVIVFKPTVSPFKVDHQLMNNKEKLDAFLYDLANNIAQGLADE